MTAIEKQPELMLQAAIQIGKKLCATAYWDDERRQCNWMGRSDILDGTIDPNATRSSALSSDLYAGGTGVALFLAELYGITREPLFSQTAAAALRRSMHYMKLTARPCPLSVHAGHLGLLYVARRLTDLDRGVDVEAELPWLLERLEHAMLEPHGFDVMAGNAGAIPLLLKLARYPGLQHFTDLAIACGEDLCRAARREPFGCIWSVRGADGRDISSTPMTGFSHGNTGIGLGLLELYAHTGNTLFREVARSAFATEDSFFNEREGNWLDPRSPYRIENGAPVGQFLTAWCHGAPGIALGRLRAMRLDPEYAQDHEWKACCGLATTLTALKQFMEQPDMDTTLCHGICGLSEVVATFADQRQDEYCRGVAADTATKLIQRYGAGDTWPSGLQTRGPNPSLMLGTAGIGYHLLRQYDPRSVPPLLVMVPK
jgi:lantibiotic biosynthesis protein